MGIDISAELCENIDPNVIWAKNEMVMVVVSSQGTLNETVGMGVYLVLIHQLAE